MFRHSRSPGGSNKSVCSARDFISVSTSRVPREQNREEQAYNTYVARRTLTDFPLSSVEDIRLLVKTPGEASLKTWCVARRRRIRATILTIKFRINTSSTMTLTHQAFVNPAQCCDITSIDALKGICHQLQLLVVGKHLGSSLA
jgi:hypothetical protein